MLPPCEPKPNLAGAAVPGVQKILAGALLLHGAADALRA